MYLSFCNAMDIPPLMVDCRENMFYFYLALVLRLRAGLSRQLQTTKVTPSALAGLTPFSCHP